MLAASSTEAFAVRSLPLPTFIEPTAPALAEAAALRVTRRVADGGAIALLDDPECATGVDRAGSVFSPSRDRTTPNPRGPAPPARAPRPAPSPPVLVLPLRGGGGPLPTTGGGAIDPGVCMAGISGVCSPPCIIMLPRKGAAEAGVANDSAPLPLCPPVMGVACIELFRCEPVHGVTGALAP